MAYKKRSFKRKRRSRKKRTYKRRRRSTMSSKSTALPIGKKFRFRTRYVESAIKYTTNLGLPSINVFSMNGLWDPNVTGIGHQPIGFDQIMPMYDHYHVIASKAKIRITNLSATDPGLFTVYLKDSSTTNSNVNNVIENGLARSVDVGPTGSSDGTRTITIKCSPSKFFGRNVMDGTKYNGNISSNPSDQVYLHLDWRPQDGTPEISCSVTIEIEYVAILTEPKQLGQS